MGIAREIGGRGGRGETTGDMRAAAGDKMMKRHRHHRRHEANRRCCSPKLVGACSSTKHVHEHYYSW